MAERVTAVLAATGVVETAKDGDTVAPPATVTVAGTVVLGSLLASVTTTPPTGAGPFKLTVPVVDPPPITDDDASVTSEAVSGPTVNVAGTVTPL